RPRSGRAQKKHRHRQRVGLGQTLPQGVECHAQHITAVGMRGEGGPPVGEHGCELAVGLLLDPGVQVEPVTVGGGVKAHETRLPTSRAGCCPRGPAPGPPTRPTSPFPEPVSTPCPTPIRTTLPPQQQLRQVPQTTPFRYRYPCVTPKIGAQTQRNPTQPVQHPHPQHQSRHVSVPFLRSKESPPWTHTTSRAHSTSPNPPPRWAHARQLHAHARNAP